MVKRLTKRSLTQLLLAAGTVAFSVAVLGFLLYRERAQLLQLQWRLDPLLIGGAFLAYFCGLTVATLVWANLMQQLGSTLPYATHIDYFCLSQLAKRLPGTLWYVASRTYLYNQVGESLRLVAFGSSLELLLTFVSGCLTTLLFAGYAVAEQTPLGWWGWVVLAGSSFVLLHPGFLHYLLRRFKIGEAPRLQYGHLLLWVFLYSVLWVIGGFVLYCTSNLVTTIGLAHLPYFIGSWSLVGTLSFVVFFLPTNLGFTEVGLSLLLVRVIPSSLAVIVAVVNRIFLLICEIGGVLLLLLAVRLWTYNVVNKHSHPKRDQRAL